MKQHQHLSQLLLDVNNPFFFTNEPIMGCSSTHVATAA